MPLSPYTATVYANGGIPAINSTNLNKSESAISAVTAEAIANASKISTLENPVSTKYDPQDVAPTHVEGQTYYDNIKKTQVIQGPFTDVVVRPGHGTHMHVINNSGALIDKGMVVRHNGVDANGNVQIVLAQADTFTNAIILGVTQHAIANLSEGAIVTQGEIDGIDTSAVSAGVPLYLSATVPGTLTATAPSIKSQVGGVKVSHVSTGALYVSIRNHVNVPTIYGILSGQTTATYPLTTTVQDIAAYTGNIVSVVTVNPTTGVITLPNTGLYRASVLAAISFTSDVTTRTVTVEVYDATNLAILFSFNKNIPRDATQDSIAFSLPMSITANDQIKLRVKSNVGFSVTFDSIIFDIESSNIIM